VVVAAVLVIVGVVLFQRKRRGETQRMNKNIKKDELAYVKLAQP
jgi:hypothetical protein